MKEVEEEGFERSTLRCSDVEHHVARGVHQVLGITTHLLILQCTVHVSTYGTVGLKAGKNRVASRMFAKLVFVLYR